MASASVATPKFGEQFDAETRWCDDRQWETLDGKLPMGVWRRLMLAKRSIYAMNALNRMLFEDQLGKSDAEDNGAAYKGLEIFEVEAMRMAVLELGDRAEEFLTEVQDGKGVS